MVFYKCWWFGCRHPAPKAQVLLPVGFCITTTPVSASPALSFDAERVKPPIEPVVETRYPSFLTENGYVVVPFETFLIENGVPVEDEVLEIDVV